jgi:O-acetyl-ADP-ribose deacetylase (regulator of RNase III)/uncharacterized protein YwgA
MVRVVVGDIFESKAQTLVNTVNCVGVMGKGIALEFKKRFPAMYNDYRSRCERGEVHLGEPYLYKGTVTPWILNFPTKDHWRSVARIQDIESGLRHVLLNYKKWGITSIAFPPLGTGLGQLEWRIIGPVLYKHISQMAIPVEFYAPYGTKEDELQLSFLRAAASKGQYPLRAPSHGWLQPSWVALMEIVRRVQQHPYHWPIGRIAFQKMAYVASEEGLPLGIDFIRGSFGPFSPDLKKVLTKLSNHGLIEEHREGNMFVVTVGPSFEVAHQAYAEDLDQWEPIIAKVADLFRRLNTRTAELVATALFAARQIEKQQRQPPTEREVLDSIAEWKLHRRPPLDPQALVITLRNLASLGWVTVEPSKEIRTPDDVLLERGG